MAVEAGSGLSRKRLQKCGTVVEVCNVEYQWFRAGSGRRQSAQLSSKMKVEGANSKCVTVVENQGGRCQCVQLPSKITTPNRMTVVNNPGGRRWSA